MRILRTLGQAIVALVLVGTVVYASELLAAMAKPSGVNVSGAVVPTTTIVTTTTAPATTTTTLI